MGQTLTNGVYLPDEGERNCYTGLARNWRAVDNHLGNANIHVTYEEKEAWNNHVADTVKHVTAADKEAWNGKADASALTAHTGDTTIHVTAEDKATWNGHIADTDKHVTASDKQTWNTVTSKANDSDVVHKSGNETINGSKTFAVSPIIYNPDTTVNNYLVLKNPKVTIGSTTDTGSQRVVFQDKNGKPIGSFISLIDSNGWTYIVLEGSSLDSQSNVITRSVRLRVTNAEASLLPSNDNNLLLGSASARWSNIYSVNYYYGNNNIEFSQKFVTTDTAQTVSGAKTFSDTLTIYNKDSSQATKNLTISSSKIQVGDTSNSDSFGIVFNAGLSYVSRVMAFKDTTGTQNLQLAVRTKDSSNNLIVSMIRLRLYANGFSTFESDGNNLVSLGSSSNKWKNVQTYQINSLEPSSLSLPDIDNRIDISSYITDLSGVNNEYTPTVNGWICVRSGNATKISILDSATSIGNQSVSSTATYLTVMTPVVANRKVYLNVVCTSLSHAYFIPCLGNV